MPFSDLPWYELLVRLQPHATAIGSTQRPWPGSPERRELWNEHERRVREAAAKVPMHNVLDSDQDREKAIQRVATELLLQDMMEQMHGTPARAEAFAKKRLRRATVDILKERSKRHVKRLRPGGGN